MSSTIYGTAWKAEYGEISEQDQFRVGRAGLSTWDATFPIASLGDLYSCLATASTIVPNAPAFKTSTLQVRAERAGLRVEVIVEQRLDTGTPASLLRFGVEDLADLLSVVEDLKDEISTLSPNDWDFSKRSDVSKEYLTVVLEQRKRVYRPESYGATGTGLTSDSAAWRAMVDDMTFLGMAIGTIELDPAARYLITDPILFDTPKNLLVEGNGATFVRTTGGLLFGNRSAEGAKGYGAGGRNVAFRNFTIEGGFSVGVLSAFHHVSNLEFKKVRWVGAIRNTHALDLAGCDNYVVEYCEFRGNVGTDAGTAYSEAIQLDVSTYGASSLKSSEPLSSYDGLPSISGKVSWNLFTNENRDGVKYATPLPIGSHNFALEDGRGYFDGIEFSNNRVVGYVRHASSGFSYGWIHLHAAKNVVIRNNIFSYEDAPAGFTDPQFVINNRPVNLVIPEADVAKTSPSTVISSVEYVARDWLIENNQFNGFGDMGVDVGNGIILFRAMGAGNDALMASEQNIVIRGNTALNVRGAVVRMFGNGTAAPNKYLIEGNAFSSSSTDNVLVTVGVVGNGTIRDNYLGKPLTRGINLLIGVGEVKVIENRTYGGNQSMRLDGILNSVVRDNVITDANSGMEVGTNSGASASDNFVYNNLVKNCATRSIRLMGLSTRCVMYGNRAVNAPAVSDGGTANVVDVATNTAVTV